MEHLVAFLVFVTALVLATLAVTLVALVAYGLVTDWLNRRVARRMDALLNARQEWDRKLARARRSHYFVSDN